MAIVKVLFRQNADRVLRYVFEHTQPGDTADSESCPPHYEGASSDFKSVRNQHDFKEGRNQAIHVVQSWDAEESKKLTPKEVNEMGRKLVEEQFKGHQFVVVTHTETGKLHNHIVVNSMHMETGKHIENKFEHWHKLKDINDEICRAKGLKIPNREANERKARVPEKLKQMQRAGRESWVFDMQTKADLARSLATSYDEYSGYMSAFGVHARVEEKNITYFYPGRDKGKRGSKLGKNYDKPGLEMQFKVNDDRFKAQPAVRDKLMAHFATLSKSQGSHSVASDESSHGAKKDYSQFTKVARHTPESAAEARNKLTRGIIPIDELLKAKRSIPEYCKQNNIPTAMNTKGKTVLRDKEYLELHGDEFHNTRNGTRGSLIEFVASHHRLTFLQAVSKINNNPGLLAFENHFGEIKRKYTSFYVPKPEQMQMRPATERVGRFLEALGASPNLAEPLLQTQRAEVSKKGVIHFFPEHDSGGSLEFSENNKGEWSKIKRGVFRKPFFKSAPKNNRLQIYTDPQLFLTGRSGNVFSDRSNRDGILALMEPNIKPVEHYLSEHKDIESVHWVTPNEHSLGKAELDFFNVLKKHLEHRGIEIDTLSHDRARSREGLDLGL